MKKKKIEIAIAGDSNYIIPLTVLLKSIFVNNSHLEIIVNFLYLEYAISEQELAQLKIFVVDHGHTINHICVCDEQLGNIPESRHSKSAFLRLLLPTLLPVHVTKVLYFDGDIVVNGSIEALYDLNIENFYIAGAKDPVSRIGRERYKQLGLPEDYYYFNSGVVLMNIERLRKEDMQEKFFAFAQKHMDVIISPDQDVLNGVLHEATCYFSPIYNYNFWIEKDIARKLFSDKELQEVWSQPVVIHYIGPIKPWCYKSIHPQRKRWWYYLKQTPYKDYQPQDKNIKNMISYLFLNTIVKPLKPLLTVEMKQKAGLFIPSPLKKVLKRKLLNAQ